MQFTTCNTLTIENNSIITIEETTIYGKSFSGTAFFYASKKPKSIIVMSNGVASAYDMSFNEIPVEDLINETKGLKDLIESKS